VGLNQTIASEIQAVFPMMSTDERRTIAPFYRRQSTRKHAWYVSPVDSSYCHDIEMTDSCRPLDKEGKVLCGHLFNADAERSQLGLAKGAGEECPISLEPIADACLQFCDKIHVSENNRELTGVELLCGHRFSAVFLLWYWVRSPMLCPMCRTHYSMKSGMASGRHPGNTTAVVEDEPPVCKVENFPVRHWRKLRGILREYRKEEEREERRLIASYHMESESILDDTLETVLGPTQQFFLMVSLSTGHGEELVQYMPLHRTNDNNTAISDDVFRFNVQRVSLRRFTTAVSQIPTLDDHIGETVHRLMRSSVVLRVGTEDGEQSFLFSVAQLADIELPAFRVHDRNSTDSSALPPDDLLSMEEAIDTLVTMGSNEQLHPYNLDVTDISVTGVSGETPVTATDDQNDVIMPHLVEDQSTLLDDDVVEHTVIAATSPVATSTLTTSPVTTSTTTTTTTATVNAPPNIDIQHTSFPTVGLGVSTTNTLSQGAMIFGMRSPLFRYTTVCAPCMDMVGLLTLQLCETVVGGGIDSLHTVSLGLQACALMSEVASCFSGM